MFTLEDQAVVIGPKLSIKTLKNDEQQVETTFSWIAGNGILAEFGPELKHAFFKAGDQKLLVFGVPADEDYQAPRHACITDPIKLVGEGHGYELELHYGMQSIEHACDWDRAAFEALEGGLVRMTMRVRLTSLPARELALLSSLINAGEVRCYLRAPQLAADAA